MDFWHHITAFYSRHSSTLSMLTMPLLFGALGWFSNWKCIKMIFHPLHFWGIPPYLGWQGLIPRNAVKFAGKTTDLLTTRLVSVDEVFSNLDSRVIAKQMEPAIDDLIEDVVSTVFEYSNSNKLIWKVMPSMAKTEIMSVARNQAPKAVRMVIRDIQKNIFEIFNIRELAMECMTGENVSRMKSLIMKVGGKEFGFLQNLGFYIGFALGVVQTLLWFIYPAPWTVPIQGAIVGGLTNWIALQMIFRPLEPKKYFHLFTYQGLFLKRRAEVTREFSKLVAGEVLNSKNIIKKILTGDAKDRINLIIRLSISQAIERMSAMVKPVITSAVRLETLDMIKHEIAKELTSSEVTELIEDYVEKALDVENVMVKKFGLLSNTEFEDILRSIFKEDEWLLIAVGGVLGLLVGFLHAYMV
jgi:uncharacterized membrane protein YheB (UPF0754 family)